MTSAGQVRLVNPADGSIVRELGNVGRDPRTVSVSPDGALVGALSIRGELTLWNVADGARRGGPMSGDGSEFTTSVSFSPSSELVAVGFHGGVVQIWSTRDGQMLGTIDNHDRRWSQVSFSPDGRLLVQACSDGTVRIWAVGSP